MNSRTIILFAAAVLPVMTYAADKAAPVTTAGSSSSTVASAAPTIEPANQGISPSDLITTRDINREIAGCTPLSAQARDVRVATYRGRIVLRGIVRSIEEKQLIEKLAHQVGGSETVVNEIEVGTNIARN